MDTRQKIISVFEGKMHTGAVFLEGMSNEIRNTLKEDNLDLKTVEDTLRSHVKSSKHLRLELEEASRKSSEGGTVYTAEQRIMIRKLHNARQ